MNGGRRRRTLTCLTVAGAALGALWSAAPAFGYCSDLHGDPAPGYSGPLMRGIHCRGGEASSQSQEESWVVPAGITTAEFTVSGGDDLIGGQGARIEATLAVAPGETLRLLLGGGGGASSVRRGDTPLLVAGGGNGLEPDYVAPAAEAVAIHPRGEPNPPYPQNGSVFVAWYVDYRGPGTDTGTGSGSGSGQDRPPESHCVIPKLRGRRPEVARSALFAAHCDSGDIVRRPARPGMRGRVTGQSQRPGTVLPLGSAVDFTVGRR